MGVADGSAQPRGARGSRVSAGMKRSGGAERVGLFVDGANLYHTSRALGFEIDFAAMLDYFRGGTYLVRAFYYTALVETED